MAIVDNHAMPEHAARYPPSIATLDEGLLRVLRAYPRQQLLNLWPHVFKRPADAGLSLRVEGVDLFARRVLILLFTSVSSSSSDVTPHCMRASSWGAD